MTGNDDDDDDDDDDDNSELMQQDGERKEDGKPCVTTVTTILFEITFAKLPFPLNRSLCKDQKTLMLSEDHDITCK